MAEPTTAQLAEGLSVTQSSNGNGLTLTIALRNAADCVLHWGLSRQPGGAWQQPPPEYWPDGTMPVDGNAVRTPFSGNGSKEVTIHLDAPGPWRGLAFVVHAPKENRWIKSGGKDFVLPLPRPQSASPMEVLRKWMPEAATHQEFALDSGDRLAGVIDERADGVRVGLACDAALPLLLHWGLAWQFRQDWQTPTEAFLPDGSIVVDGKSAQTPFVPRDGLSFLEMRFPRPADGSGPRGMRFVLHHPDGEWLKSGNSDLFLPLFAGERDRRLASPLLEELADEIVSVEKGAGSWTLMHRFNLCHDLLGKAGDDADAWALLFAWMRYSAIRQLDWQRRYNTKPRELSHAQDRLSARLGSLWRGFPPSSRCRFWARLMLTTMGRGGEGQRVRDEILHIMHRNHLKEMAGQFIEEWHQKLHNNTTPDDVVICTAYLAFLRSNGDVGLFYRTLEQGGVTRDRLRSFERPIRTDPTFYGDKKDALIGEFENFLRILKSVHTGTDLDSAAGAVRGRLSPEANRHLDEVFARRGQPSALANAVTIARDDVAKTLAATGDAAGLRDLLFLDLALQECLRTAMERVNLSQAGRDELMELVRLALRNLTLTVESAELSICTDHWSALMAAPREGRETALHVRSVADRAGRWVRDFSDDTYRQLQPKAEVLGSAFGVESWTIPLFSEEIIRGGPAFTLSLLLRPLDLLLRKAAGIGGWQIISPARADGKVRRVARLLDVQSERFAEPTVLLADAVSGEEEIPANVTAVLTRSAPDIVSHVAVRARNAGVLFATRFDDDIYQRLVQREGHALALQVTPGGDVQESKTPSANTDAEKPKHVHAATAARRPQAAVSAWVLTQDQFAEGIVGGKSNNLNSLRGRLSEAIQLPKSLALPFGTCERVLDDQRNRGVRDACAALIAAVERNPTETLAALRAKLEQLEASTALREALLACWQRTGLPAVPWEKAWHAIRRVWASKWNERAYLSRRARGTPHESLRMAVLVQEVVPADYAFVIHTANPLTGARDELFAEVVLGLGETLVGNYPGRALSFVCRKKDLTIEILSYPGKSLGLYGRGVIFRSDSNGEDLEGFAGAGLYDSFLADEPKRRLLDYRGEKLVWDESFRLETLRSIARAGLEVERLLGSAQDIEGAIAGGRLYVVQTRPQVGLNNT